MYNTETKHIRLLASMYVVSQVEGYVDMDIVKAYNITSDISIRFGIESLTANNFITHINKSIIITDFGKQLLQSIEDEINRQIKEVNNKIEEIKKRPK